MSVFKKEANARVGKKEAYRYMASRGRHKWLRNDKKVMAVDEDIEMFSKVLIS